MSHPNNIRELPTLKKEAVESVVSTLEGLLERAKNGEITGFAGTVLYANMMTGTVRSATESSSRILGGLTFAIHDIIKDC